MCIAVCCSVLRCVAVCCSVLQCVAVYCSVLQCVAMCRSVLQCVAVCCSSHAHGSVKIQEMRYMISRKIHIQRHTHHQSILLQLKRCNAHVPLCVAACCSVLQCVAVITHTHQRRFKRRDTSAHLCVTVCCSVLQCVTVCCSEL